MTRVDDRALPRLRRLAASGRNADEETGDFVDGLLGCRQADAHRRLCRQRGKPLQRQGEVAAALAAGERVNLVDDDGARRREHAAARFRAEQDIERLRRRDDDVRRALAHAHALGLRRVAGAHERPDIDVGESLRLELAANAGEWRGEVTPDVVRERLQRRDVNDERFIGQRRLEALAKQAVNRREKCRERLARPRRGGDQHVVAALDQRPRARLRRGRARKIGVEPAREGGVKKIGRDHRCTFTSSTGAAAGSPGRYYLSCGGRPLTRGFTRPC